MLIWRLTITWLILIIWFRDGPTSHPIVSISTLGIMGKLSVIDTRRPCGYLDHCQTSLLDFGV